MNTFTPDARKEITEHPARGGTATLRIGEGGGYAVVPSLVRSRDGTGRSVIVEASVVEVRFDDERCHRGGPYPGRTGRGAVGAGEAVDAIVTGPDLRPGPGVERRPYRPRSGLARALPNRPSRSSTSITTVLPPRVE